MLPHEFVLADVDLVGAYSHLCHTRGLVRDSHCVRDPTGNLWSVARFDYFSIGIPLFGQGWMFDHFAVQRRQSQLEERRTQVSHWTSRQQEEELRKIVNGVRFGPLTFRLLWYIHHSVVSLGRSVFRLPDSLIREALWGRHHPPPAHWRGEVRTLLNSLAWLHVATKSEDNDALVFNTKTALLTHAADLHSRSTDACDDDCPASDGRHSHFLLNVGRGFLGHLERFASETETDGVRSYIFPRLGQPGERTLRTEGKSGKIVSIYLPAVLGSPSRCSSLTTEQHRLLRTVIRETTRYTKKDRKDYADAETFSGTLVPPVQADRRRKKSPPIVCPLLNEEATYVGFNGNGKRKGRGYLVATWMRKAGYADSSSRQFVHDLRVLSDRLGIIVVGYQPISDSWLSLEQLDTVVASRPSLAAKLHLRIFSEEGHVARWNRFFDWQPTACSNDVTVSSVTVALCLLKQHDIRRSEAAEALGID